MTKKKLWITAAGALCLVVAIAAAWAITAGASNQEPIPTQPTTEEPVDPSFSLPTQEATEGITGFVRPGMIGDNGSQFLEGEQAVLGTLYIRTGSPSEGGKPVVLVFRTVEEFRTYCQEHPTLNLEQALQKYDETYFKTRELVMAVVTEGSGSVRHELLSVGQKADGSWVLRGTRKVPEAGTADMAQWCLFAELPQGRIPVGQTPALELHQ